MVSDGVPFEEGAYELAVAGEVNQSLGSRSESESEQGVESAALDPKPSDLSMSRVKRG